MKGSVVPTDRWTRRGVRNLSTNLSRIRNSELYQNIDRYRRAVRDLNRVLEMSLLSGDVRLSLVNYQHQELAPVRSGDLLRAAEAPEMNPFFPYFQERLSQIVESQSPALAGVSLNYLSQALCTFAILGFLKRTYPEITLVLGGGLVTSWMRKPGWKNPFTGLVDHLVSGPGEQALLSLCGIDDPMQAWFVPSYEFDSDIVPAGRPLQDCAFPAISDLASSPPATPDSRHHNTYLSPGFILPYSSSNGCYWGKCTFCPERAEGTPYEPIPVCEVTKEVQSLEKKTNPVMLHMLDNAITPRLLKAFAGDPPGVPWYGFARVTSHLADEDFCVALKHSGCAMLQLGIESGDQSVLDSEQKGINLEVASRALKNLRKAGIATYVYLLFGTPAETLREARKTLQFTAQHADEIEFLNLAVFNLPVYGKEAQALTTRMHYEGDLSLYADFIHPKGWNRALVRQFLDKEFRREPAIASIIRRDPPFFSSNHAPFFSHFRSSALIKT
jgi:radical SAM superfamily enzyme YgiQ (UPF0313 family)